MSASADINIEDGKKEHGAAIAIAIATSNSMDGRRRRLLLLRRIATFRIIIVVVSKVKCYSYMICACGLVACGFLLPGRPKNTHKK